MQVEGEHVRGWALTAPLDEAGLDGSHLPVVIRYDGRVTIDPSLLADDKDMLEDLVAAAFNDGIRRAEEVSQEKMGKLTAGMPLPPGMKFPF